jgi:hypothetical protein
LGRAGGVTRSYQPDFDIDRDYGESGEATVRRILGLSEYQIEVKRKTYVDDQFYVEFEHDPGATETYKPSGLSTTSAEYFAYVIGDSGVIVFVPTDLLRQRLADALG